MKVATVPQPQGPQPLQKITQLKDTNWQLATGIEIVGLDQNVPWFTEY